MRSTVSTLDTVKALLHLVRLPGDIFISLLRRCVFGSQGKPLSKEILLTVIRWTTQLPLSLKRKVIDSRLDVSKALSSPRYSKVKQRLCQHVEHDNFSGYWISQGHLNGAATAPADCDYVLLWIHGGAYVLGNSLMALIQVLRISEIMSSHGLSSATFSLDYALAPEAAFPEAFDQGVSAYRYLMEVKKVPAEKIIICGDSAGGHLALTVLDMLQRAKLPKPGYALLQYPWVDLTNKGESVVRNKHNDMLVASDLNQAVLWASRSLPDAFKDNMDFSAPRPSGYWSNILPTTWVGVGSHDLFVDSVRSFVQHAQDDGCNITFEIWETAPHGWPTMQDTMTIRRYLKLQPDEAVGDLTPGSETIAKAVLRMVKPSGSA